MKKLMITGGMFGFVLGLGLGLAQGNGWPASLWRASFCSLAAGLLLRWWGRVWFESFRQVCAERLSAQGSAESASRVSPLT